MSVLDIDEPFTFTLDHELSMVIDELFDEFGDPISFNEQPFVEQSSTEQNIPDNFRDQAMPVMDNGALNVVPVPDIIDHDAILDAPNTPEV